MDWIKIGTAVFLVLLLVYLFPSAKHMLTNSPKAKSEDWQALLLPLLGIVGFVVLLVWMVSK